AKRASRVTRKWSIRYLPASGPSASSPAASSSQPTAGHRWRRSGEAARTSRRAASPISARFGGVSPGLPVAASDSTGIEAGLQLLVAPLACVPAGVVQELVVGSVLGDAPALQHEHVVGVGHRAQAMAHDHD